MSKSVLMVGFHFPPMRGKSGTQRIVKFCRYLPDEGWVPTVLTTNVSAYPDASEDLDSEIPEVVRIKRAFALDAGRHLHLIGGYPRCLAIPDRWASWWITGVPLGLYLIQRCRPDVIWSTFPIATAHLIGLTLSRLKSIPWIADFRDPMTEDDYPPHPAIKTAFRWIEKETVSYADRSVFTTPGALRMYAERYPQIPEHRWAIIPNGYDEEAFSEVENFGMESCKRKPCVLLHSGVLYPSERDPSSFFLALAELYAKGSIDPSSLKVILRDSGNEDYYRYRLKKLCLENIVFLKPGIPFRMAVSEMTQVDGLLIFQSSSCNHQIPAKVYECFRAGRPIFAMTDPSGDTASLLQSVGIDTIVPLNDKEEIKGGLVRFLADLRRGTVPTVDKRKIVQHSRRHRAKDLARLFDSVID